MPPVIGKGERRLVYAIVISIDILQVILTPFVFVNNIIDFVIGGGLVAYALKRKLLTAHKGLVIGATFLAEQIPFVNALPFWTYDVYNLYKGTVKELPEESGVEGPMYRDGYRRPLQPSTPLNENGRRAPQKV